MKRVGNAALLPTLQAAPPRGANDLEPDDFESSRRPHMNTTRKWLIAAACLLLAAPVFAQPYTISADETEVTDSQTGLTWRRCSEG